MRQYIIRLDDASEYMDVEKWEKAEYILDKYQIKPIVGIIPDNKDDAFLKKYCYNPYFWEIARRWRDKEWILAMHGFDHKYITEFGGINPVQKRSEFAGVPYDHQAQKIREGLSMLESKGIIPTVFFAPSHTFDENTIKALKKESSIRIISDTVAYDSYCIDGMHFVPQQSGRVRSLPFRVTTFCYHPNELTQQSFCELDRFLEKNRKYFAADINDAIKERPLNIVDKLLSNVYFLRRKNNLCVDFGRR